jgi:glycosyltransferase involved in cell wall biosynthesis
MPSGNSISACVICKDQADRVGLTLDSLTWCVEIVVVDSGSTDGTVEVCRGHASGKVRVISEPWRGFSRQRQFAAEQCSRAWVLMMDADEECSPELRCEIEALREAEMERVAIFEMPRKNFVAKRHVRCWGPDYQTRFIHKARVHWDPAAIPEQRTPMEGFVTAHLRGAILHNRLTPYSPEDFADGRRMADYAALLAQTMYAKGRRAGFLNLLFRPGLAFFKYYILRGGFLDGRFGLAIAYRGMIGVMLKYSLLYGKELENR